MACPDDLEDGGGTYSVDGQAVTASTVRCETRGFEAREPGSSPRVPLLSEINSGFIKPNALGVFPSDDGTEFLLYAHSRTDGLEIDIERNVQDVLFTYEGDRIVSTAAAEELGLSFDLQCGLGPPPEINYSLGS